MWLFSSICIQNLNWAAPANFRTQIEQMRTHYKQPQFAFEANWRSQTLYEPQHKNLKCLLKIKGTLIKIINIRPLLFLPSPLKLYHFQTILIWWHSPFNSLVLLAQVNWQIFSMNMLTPVHYEKNIKIGCSFAANSKKKNFIIHTTHSLRIFHNMKIWNL
jgi:hypothetical protein